MNKIDPKQTTNDIVDFIKKTFKREKFTRAVIGLSGGIDSSISCTLTVQALGKKNVFPIILPYEKLAREHEKDALRIVNLLQIPKINVSRINIDKFLDIIMSLDPTMDSIRKGNIMARVRMIIIFDQAKKRKAMTVGTENRSEHLLGYFTRFGDEASDIEPIRGLYKTQLYDLGRYLKMPHFILHKHPTAGLWQNQTDEGEFGFTYKQADEILYQLFDEKKSATEILKSGFDKETISKVVGWVNKNKFKHRVPYLP